MNGANKRAALAAVDGLQAGGGTVIGPALDEIAGRSLGECGLIIIGDLEFDVAKQRPMQIYDLCRGSRPSLWLTAGGLGQTGFCRP